MFYKRTNSVWVLLLVFFELRCHNAQKVNSTSGNQDPGLSSVDTRFFDVNGPNYDYPNSRPGRFGNSPSNYLGNSPPYGNQNGNMQQPGYGWTPNSQNPNQGYYQARPDQQSGYYPGNQGNNPYQQNPNNYNGGYNPGYTNMNQYPNNRRPYSNRPGNGVYPGNGSPYQNGGMPYNQGGYPNQPDTRYPQNGQYYPQGNYQGNPNYGAGGYGPEYPNNLNNGPNSNIQFPENMPSQNQYPTQNGINNQGNMNVRPNLNNYPSYPPANLNTHVQFPGNNPNYNEGSGQFPNQDMNQGNPNDVAVPNQVPGSFNGPQIGPEPNNQQIDSINGPNANDSTVLGSPVFVPSSTTSPGQLVFDGSSVSPGQTQCEQNCQTTSEYSPVCGTNNVTYSNPGRFYCARNCGVAVNLRQMGRCNGEPAANNSQQ